MTSSPISLSSVDCVVFDMDGTLAPSKGKIADTMAQTLNRLLEKKYVAVISGGAWEQFETQLVPFLSSECYEKLVILPTSGTTMYRYVTGTWKQEYREVIPTHERRRITHELQRALARVGYHEAETYGEVIEDRETQVTFSGLGSRAPLEKKKLWDPEQKKRRLIVSMLQDSISDYELTIGGTTSIDITMKGIDKAYGVEKLHEYLNIPFEKMLFIGDKLSPGGNDYAVTRLPVQTIAVEDERETERVLTGLLAQ